MSESKLYVGHLLPTCTEQNIREAFDRFGTILKIDMKNGFCFVSYGNVDAADRALNELHNKAIDGSESLNIQVAKGRQDRLEPKARMQDRFRILVDNVVPEASWMDLKDFARDRGVIAHYAVCAFTSTTV